VDEFGSSLKFSKSETEEAVSRILKYVEDKEKGTLNTSREIETSLALPWETSSTQAAPGG
jgi:hypothetical protein